MSGCASDAGRAVGSGSAATRGCVGGAAGQGWYNMAMKPQQNKHPAIDRLGPLVPDGTPVVFGQLHSQRPKPDPHRAKRPWRARWFCSDHNGAAALVAVLTDAGPGREDRLVTFEGDARFPLRRDVYASCRPCSREGRGKWLIDPQKAVAEVSGLSRPGGSVRQIARRVGDGK